MTINITVPDQGATPELKPRISVIGVGGAGGNAVGNMIAANLEGCDFIVANTDSQALAGSKAERRIQLGNTVTGGLGAGSKPDVGRAAAEESISEVMAELQGSNMVFIAAGMGGGTGTGAAPVIAQAAKQQGILTVGVVTKPFQFEGAHRSRLADQGIEELGAHVDTLIIIPNQNLFRVANEKTTFADAFKMADDVLYSGVRSITDLMVMPGLINLDFADVQSVMAGMGRAMMGTGEAEGERRAIEAAEAAISNPLLDDASMRGARGVLINITGGPDITLFEVDEAANRVRAEVDEDAYIIIGSAFDESMQGNMRVSVVAAGLEAQEGVEPSHMNMLGVKQTQRLEPVRVPRPEPVEPTNEVASTVADLTDEPLELGRDQAVPSTPLEAAVEVSAATAEQTGDPMGEMPAENILAMETEAEVSDDLQAELDALADDLGAPAAMPSSENLETFIPSKPVEVKRPQPETQSVTQTSQPAAAFGTADLVNGGVRRQEKAPGKAKGLFTGLASKEKKPSLFERVTGTGRAKEEAQDAAPVSNVVQGPTGGGAAEAMINGRPDTLAGSPVEQGHQPESAPVRSMAQPSKQSALAVDPDDRVKPSEQEEDLLDIPAFLRRQAN